MDSLPDNKNNGGINLLFRLIDLRVSLSFGTNLTSPTSSSSSLLPSLSSSVNNYKIKSIFIFKQTASYIEHLNTVTELNIYETNLISKAMLAGFSDIRNSWQYGEWGGGGGGQDCNRSKAQLHRGFGSMLSRHFLQYTVGSLKYIVAFSTLYGYYFKRF